MAFTPGEVAEPRRFISADRTEVSFSVWRSLSLARRGPKWANTRKKRGKRKMAVRGYRRDTGWKGEEGEGKGEFAESGVKTVGLRSLNIRWKLRLLACKPYASVRVVSSSSFPR